ncbi:MAG: hypothetical protein WC838_03755 [Candidatus Margulisiibacteriota bacterium]
MPRRSIITCLGLLISLCCFAAKTVEPVSFTPSSLILSAGYSQKVLVKGLEEGSFSIGGYDAEVISAVLKGLTVEVTGKRQGDTIIFIVNDSGFMAGLRVVVKEPGAFFPLSLRVEVSGKPAPDGLIRDAVAEAIRRETLLKDGVELKIPEVFPGLQSLNAGQSMIINVPVGTSSNVYANQDKQLSVQIVNLNLAYKEDDYLLMSNNPEIITGAGLLFKEEIKKNESARLVYHHMNEFQGPERGLRVILKNPTDKEAIVLINRGIGGPNIDALYAGHIATRRFVNNLLNKSGAVIVIPPKQETVIVEQSMPEAEDSVTGIIKIWLTQGDKIEVQIKAYETLEKVFLFPDDEIEPYLPNDGIAGHVKAAFNTTRINMNLEYNTDQKQSSIDLGLVPKVYSSDEQSLLLGNYGITHDIYISLSNPSAQAKTVKLSCLPTGGLARGIFLFDQEVIETGLLDPHSSNGGLATIKTFVLQPLAQKEFMLSTIPQAGSYYPVKLMLRSS